MQGERYRKDKREQWREWLARGGAELGIKLDEKKISLAEIFADELVDASRKINLTSISDPLEIAENLILDSMVPGKYIPSKTRVLDIGTGAGIPGIPLKIAFPDLDLTLVDGRRKRINFVKHAIRRIGLDSIEARHARAEDIAGENEKFGVVVSRAVSSIQELFRLAAPLIKPDGMLMAMKGRGYESEINAEQLAGPDQTRVPNVRIEKYRLPQLGVDRVIVIVTL